MIACDSSLWSLPLYKERTGFQGRVKGILEAKAALHAIVRFGVWLCIIRESQAWVSKLSFTLKTRSSLTGMGESHAMRLCLVNFPLASLWKPDLRLYKGKLQRGISHTMQLWYLNSLTGGFCDWSPPVSKYIIFQSESVRIGLKLSHPVVVTSTRCGCNMKVIGPL